MNSIKFFILLFFIFFNTTTLKAEESIVAGVDGMFCLACQEKLKKNFSQKFGSEATVTVSWEKGLAVVSFPTKGKISEEDFKNVISTSGFNSEAVKTVSKPLNNLKEVEKYIEENPGTLILKSF